VATPAQPVAQAVPSLVRFRLSKSLQVLLGERLLRRNITLEKYFVELIEADIAPLRLANWLDKVPPAPVEEIRIKTKGRQEVAAARVQRILHLHEQYVSPGNIAQRLGLSLMTVRRILKEHAQSTIHVQRPGVTGCRASTPRFWER
jgi:hypothetical protein